MQAQQLPRGPGLVPRRGAVDHRASRRYAAYGTSVQLGWWEGSEFRVALGLLKDISRGGAAVLAEASPPAGEPLFIRLNGSRLTEWLEATAVEVSKNRWFRRVPRQVRLQFADPCPYNFFQAAIDVLIMDCSVPGDSPKSGDPDRNAPMYPRSKARRAPSRSAARWM